jgi:cytochrome c oxidase subunit 4
MRVHQQTSPVTYIAVFVGLLALTATTVAVAGIPLGLWHTPVALAIAIAKATLVVLFFMHALHSNRLTWIVIGGAILWLGIMLALTLADFVSRDWLSQATP